jgi:hypothetical protein
MLDKPGKPFSKRHKYSIQNREITIREDAPENLWHFILETVIELGFGPAALREDLCAVLHVRPDPNNWSEYPNVWEEVQGLIYNCQWFRVYDFIERLYERFEEYNEETEKRKKVAPQFQQALNEFFIEEGIGWQLVDGEIVTRGTEAFESATTQAVATLDKAGGTTARDEIHEARTDLSRRPEPDLTGAIQHGMAALECVARDVCGDPKATLGVILKKKSNLIPKPLDMAIEKAWGYASEMGRHIREGRQLNRKEAELIVSLAATISTYLSK